MRGKYCTDIPREVLQRRWNLCCNGNFSISHV